MNPLFPNSKPFWAAYPEMFTGTPAQLSYKSKSKSSHATIKTELQQTDCFSEVVSNICSGK